MAADTDEKVKELLPDDTHLHAWLDAAREVYGEVLDRAAKDDWPTLAARFRGVASGQNYVSVYRQTQGQPSK